MFIYNMVSYEVLIQGSIQFDLLQQHSEKILRLLASANSTTVVELIVELIGELFIVELLNYNFLGSQKACFN